MCPDRGTNMCPEVKPRLGHFNVPRSGHVFVPPGHLFVPRSGHVFVPPGHLFVPRGGHFFVPPGHFCVPQAGLNFGAHFCAPFGSLSCAPYQVRKTLMHKKKNENNIYIHLILHTLYRIYIILHTFMNTCVHEYIRMCTLY
jgi:hypothetical protein